MIGLLMACVGAKPSGDAEGRESGQDPGETSGPDSAEESGTETSGESGGETGASPAPGGPYFPAEAPWYLDFSTTDPDPSSEAIIAWLQDAGWGNGRMQIDFSIEVLETTAEAPFAAFEPNRAYFWSPDCDAVEMPLPEGGAIEGEDGYACTSGGDCHLLVPYWPTMELYEMYHADVRGDRFTGGCLAVWDMTRTYGPEGRGDQCTSADAAGFPITPLLFSADEVAAGEIAHAIRFILPNETMRAGVYVRPATHAGSPDAAAPAPPYGARLRLRADYPLETLPNEGARVVARALQRYGMLLADGGNITLTARSDRFTEAKWQDHLGPHDLADLEPQDFDVMPLGEVLDLTYDCERVD